MKLKQVAILGIILLLLLGIAIVKQQWGKPPVEEAEYEPLDISFVPEEVAVITLTKGQKEQIVLERKDEGWFIPSQWNLRARKTKIDEFLASLSGMEGEVRSTAEELFPDYGISDEEAFSIVLKDKEGSVLEEFLVGTQKGGFGSSFLRRRNSPLVYLVDTDILQAMGVYGDPQTAALTSKVWRDLAIIKFDTAAVKSIKIKAVRDGRFVTTLEIVKEFDEEKKLDHWVTSGKPALFDLDAAKIKSFLNRLNNLYASDAVDPKGENYGFKEPYLTLTLEGDDTLWELIVGAETKEGSNQRYLKTSQGYAFILSQYRLKKLDIDTSSFFVDNPLRIDKEELTSIVVKSGRETVTLHKELISKNEDYINTLKEFAVKALSYKKEYARGLRRAPYILKVTKNDNSTTTLYVRKENDETYVGQIIGKDDVFLISAGVFEGIFKGLATLKK